MPIAVGNRRPRPAATSRDRTGARRTVAIWGSCVTRDAFAVPDRRAELEERLPLVYYGARSSWISQASAPWSPPEQELVPLSGFAARMVHEDLAKAVVPQLVAHRPDIVVIDLMAERDPLLRFGHSWLTATDYLHRTPFGRRARDTADEVSLFVQRRRRRLFVRATRTLGRHLCRELPGTTFVLNESPYVTRVAGDRELSARQVEWARRLQARQKRLFGVLGRVFGDRLVRLSAPPRVCLADPDHRWGLASYHLVPDYHHWLLDRLLSLEPAGP